MLVIAIIFAGCALAPASRTDEPGRREAERTRLYFRIETTSDWCDLMLIGGPEIESGIITAYSELSEVGMDSYMVHIHQPIAHAEAGTMVYLEACIDVFTDGNDIDLEIRKGAIGDTQVIAYGIDNRIAEKLDTFSCRDDMGVSEDYKAVFQLNTDRISGRPDNSALPYPAGELEAQLADWKRGIIEFTFPAYSLYWPEAKHITARSDGYYTSANAVQSLKEELERGPDPSLDYSLLDFSTPVFFPTSDTGEARLLLFSTYNGNPGGSDLFTFEKRDTVWKIAEQFWKLGFDIQ